MSQNNNDNSRLYDKIDRIDDKIERKFDKIEKRLDSMEKELIIYNEELKHHIEGVQRAREHNQMLQKYIDVEIEKLRTDFKPVIKHIKSINSVKDGLRFMVGVSLKIIGAVGLVLGAYMKYKGLF